MPHQFTTIRTADILDQIIEAVDAAREKMTANQVAGCWFTALDKGYEYLLTTDVIAFDAAAHAIRLPSATRAGLFYIANGDCQCEAFTLGGGCCWHRTAARIVRRALELQAARPAAPAPAPRLRRCDDLTVSAADLVSDLYA